MLGRLDMELLEALVVVAEVRSFTQAAKILARTQPAVSMQIKKLEGRCSCHLFVRNSREGMTLTPEGRVLLPYAKRIVDLSEEARSVLSPVRMTGSLKLGLPERFGTQELNTALGYFARLHNTLQFQIVIHDSFTLRRLLHEQKLDVVLASTPHTNDLDSFLRRTWQEPWRWVASRTYVSSIKSPVPLAVFPPPSRGRESAIEGLESIGRTWREALVASRTSSIVGALHAGLAVAFLPFAATASVQNLRVLKAEDGFPEAPANRVGLYCQGDPVTTQITHELMEMLAEFVDRTLLPASRRSSLPLAVEAEESGLHHPSEPSITQSSSLAAR